MKNPVSSDTRFGNGIRFFNTGYFFEAHEEWEGLWRGAGESPEKHFLQGMIMIAAAFHHCKRKESGGTLRLLERGIGILNEYREAEMDLEVRDFLKEITRFRDTYRASPCSPGQAFPRLKRRNLGRGGFRAQGPGEENA